ncbi:condensin-2 complex subunit D3 [Eurytemora carolleeae]|uniref:condensin-2 complex subunit D3 n=1 Tax=Eurytemora carolleeae TaxID=1294199 RepID=UPI000C7830B4|nr:condensin-2 complex subunit D3 [Eurytemora carolleeae]|eukprot:XP_023339088.1 condensin-2 complex subunit D3-like [Eurytemora affinis]
MVQQVAAKVPDKADYRREAGGSIMLLLSLFDAANFSVALRWFIQYSMTSKTSSRIISLEVLGRLVEALQATGSSDEHKNILTEYSRLIFTSIYNRTNDTAPSVKTQALKVLGEMTASQSAAVKTLLIQVNSI